MGSDDGSSRAEAGVWFVKCVSVVAGEWPREED